MTWPETSRVLSSGDITADEQISTEPGFLVFANVSTTGGLGAADMSCYDGTDNTGTLLLRLRVNSNQLSDSVSLVHPIRFHEGLFVEVSSPDAAVVHYSM